MPPPLISKLSKSIAGGVGLAQEAYYHNKEKKRASRSPSPQPPGVDDNDEDFPPGYEEIDHDEDDWIADEAQASLQHLDINVDDLPTSEPTDQIIQKFLTRHITPPNLTSTSPLPGPVVVPQKRPSARTRGFVRAYAPALEQCGVSQEAFLDFLSGFDQEIRKQNAFNVANLAVAISVISYFAAAAAPSIAVKFAAMAVHVSIEGGRRLYMSKKENKYLDELNEKYFQPRGLYAMVMAYKPGNNDILAQLDFSSTAAAAIDKRTDTENKSRFSDYRAASGKTRDGQLPNVCPLVYPGLEQSGASEEQKDNAFKRAMAFTRDYYDRRSQVEFADKHPESGISMQEHQFAGSYGDPRNHQQSGLLGVLTNNHIDPAGRRLQRRNQRRVAMGRKPRGQSGGLVKKAFQDSMLYVLIVNMPSEQELQEAKETLEEMKKQKGNSWW